MTAATGGRARVPGVTARAGSGATAMAVAATVVAVLPVWLTGGLSVFMAADLAFDEQQLGVAVACFFLTSALVSVPGGRLAERLGARVTLCAVAVVASVALLGIALAVASWPALVVMLVLAGVANGVVQPAANLRLAQAVPPSRRALAFGVKQSAFPAATLLAGLAVPLIGLTLGWRAGFGGAAVLAVGVVVAASRGTAGTATARSRGRASTGRWQLVTLAVAAGAGSGAANAMAAFLVPSAVAAGLSPGTAGALLVVASAGCIAVRILVGWRADARVGGHLRVVTLLLSTACAGYALLAAGGGTGVVVAGTLLAFSVGWGWPGLFHFAVVERNPDGPAAATGVTQAGIFLGAVIGPSAFGTIVVTASYRLAWSALAVAGLMAAVLVAATSSPGVRASRLLRRTDA